MVKEVRKPSDSASVRFPSAGRGEVAITPAQGQAISGSSNLSLCEGLINQLIGTIPGLTRDEYGEHRAHAALAMMEEIGPRDGLEGMLAAQMIAIHNLALECARRAALPNQTLDSMSAEVSRVAKLTRTFTAQMEALQRYRTGGRQKIVVQHVNVESGGQAVVGDVSGGRGNG